MVSESQLRKINTNWFLMKQIGIGELQRKMLSYLENSPYINNISFQINLLNYQHNSIRRWTFVCAGITVSKNAWKNWNKKKNNTRPLSVCAHEKRIRHNLIKQVSNNYLTFICAALRTTKVFLALFSFVFCIHFKNATSPWRRRRIGITCAIPYTEERANVIARIAHWSLKEGEGYQEMRVWWQTRGQDVHKKWKQSKNHHRRAQRKQVAALSFKKWPIL